MGNYSFNTTAMTVP